MTSYLDDQFSYQKDLSEGPQTLYSKYFTINNSNITTTKLENKQEYRGCIYDAQGGVSCKSWSITKDGYSIIN